MLDIYIRYSLFAGETKNQLKYFGSDVSMIQAEIAFAIAWDTKVWTTASGLGY